MGANCCVAARHEDIPQRRSLRFSTQRNVRHSPSWSFQWNNQMAQDVADNLARVSHLDSGNVGLEVKSEIGMEKGLSDGGTALDSFGSPNWHKSPTYVGTAGGSEGSETASNHLPPAASLSIGCDSFSEGLRPVKSSATGSLRKSKVSTLMTPSSAFKGETSSSCIHSHLADPTSSRKACRSPGYPLSRQTSDSHISMFKSLNERNLAEGRKSVGESFSGSSDSWSLHLFSELVASSQRERWSFGTENMSSNHGKITRSNSQPFVSPLPAVSQSCGVCSKLLKEKSSWGSQKISNSELSVVAVLGCGHVYHAECLENVTPEADRYDPSCPVCTNGEKSASKLLGKGKAEVKGRNKISRNAVADIDLDGFPISGQWKSAEWEAKDSKLASSSSFKSLGRPFLRRHFSIGSRPTRCVSENEVTRKNFWGRYRRNE